MANWIVRRTALGQSELLGSVILVVLVLLIGLSGFLLANSWVSQRYSEGAFNSFADLCLSEFLGSLISVENRSSARVVYVGVVRVGVLSERYDISLSIFYGSSPSPSWWVLNSVQSSDIGYNVSASYLFLGNLSFRSPVASVGVGSSSAYVKQGGSWYSLRDLGFSGSITLYWVGVLGPQDILFLNITLRDAEARYLYIVLWTRYNDRYVAIPLQIPLS